MTQHAKPFPFVAKLSFNSRQTSIVCARRFGGDCQRRCCIVVVFVFRWSKNAHTNPSWWCWNQAARSVNPVV